MEKFFGGAAYSTATVTTLAAHGPRVQTLNPAGAGASVALPSALGLSLGGPHYILLNLSHYAVAIVDAAGGAVLMLGARKAASIGLLNNASAAGRWNAVVSDLNTPRPAACVDRPDIPYVAPVLITPPDCSKD